MHACAKWQARQGATIEEVPHGDEDWPPSNHQPLVEEPDDAGAQLGKVELHRRQRIRWCTVVQICSDGELMSWFLLSCRCLPAGRLLLPLHAACCACSTGLAQPGSVSAELADTQCFASTRLLMCLAAKCRGTCSPAQPGWPATAGRRSLAPQPQRRQRHLRGLAGCV